MPSDEPGKSPLAPSGSPGAPPPEAPRLGISHLLILTACVAVHLGLTRMVAQGWPREAAISPGSEVESIPAALEGIGAGAALAGLLLLVARYRRGLPFPVHPGEYLLVLLGLCSAGLLADNIFAWYAVSLGPQSGALVFSAIFRSSLLVLYCLAFLWVVIRVKTIHWRLFFLGVPAGYVLYVGLVFILLRLASPIVAARHRGIAEVALRLVIAGMLAVVVLKDHLDGRRYPWTHWFGVGTRFWLDAVAVVAAAWSVLWPT